MESSFMGTSKMIQALHGEVQKCRERNEHLLLGLMDYKTATVAMQKKLQEERLGGVAIPRRL